MMTQLTPDISVLEVVWTVVAAIGLLFSVRLILRGRRWFGLMDHRHSQDPRVEVAMALVFRGTIKFLIFTSCLLAGIDAMTKPQIDSGSSVSGALVVLAVEILTGVLAVYDEIMHRRIVRALEASESASMDIFSHWESYS